MKKAYILYILFLVVYCEQMFSQCGSGTPSFTANLTASPTATWVSPSIPRADTCCGWSGSDNCIKFTVFLNPASNGINFNIASGAVPPGGLFYSINCGPPISVGTPICLSGTGPHVLTFCKPGNNSNTYAISAIPAPVVPDSILVRNGCTQTIAVTGFSVPTIMWNSVNPGPSGAFNSYLNCTAGCASVMVTPTGTPPAFVDYQVSGYGQSPCQAAFYIDTVRVYFYSDLLAGINPTLTTICFGSTSAVLTATVSGGLPGYTYSWTPGGNTTTVVTVGPGTYTVMVFDKTGCPPTQATAVVNQYTLPIAANAGTNIVQCKSNPLVALSGTVTNATGGVWSGGGGTFTPVSNSVSTNYVATAGELISGAQLYLTTTGNSGCPPKQDTLNITFQNIPLANAGPDHTVCANNNSVILTGTVSGFSSTGQWASTGTGAFTSTTNLNTTYNPSAGDASTGLVNIILSSTANGVCPAAKDTTKIIITPSPTVNAGPDQTICSNGFPSLAGIVSGPTSTGIWSTSGDGTFSPANTQLNANYLAGPNDILTGTVSLILSSTGNGNCLQVKDTVKIYVTKLAVVNAGPSQLICAATPTINLNGLISGGTTTGIWSTSGTGAFNPASTSLNTNYFISVSDLSAGVLIFTLTSSNNGVCPAVKDTLLVSIVPLPIVNAGVNQFLCSTTNTLALAGTINSNANTGMWSSGSGGVFFPNNTALSTSYSISLNDINTGIVIFTLTSTNNGPCPAVKDTVKIKIRKPAQVNAGNDQTICSTSTSIVLNGMVSAGGSTGVWNTNGSGNFSPNNTSLNTNYNVSNSDINNVTVLFILTSTNNEVCPAVVDTVKLTIIKKPIISLSSDTAICAYQNPLHLIANVSGGNGQYQWSTNGFGTFSISTSVNAINYSLSSIDITNGFVQLTISSINNGPCGNLNSSINVVIHPAPIAGFIASTYTANIPNDPIQFTNQSTGANAYYWNFGDGGFTTVQNPIHNYNIVGFYNVILIATNQFNCKDTVIKEIKVISDIQFPNVFTPNINGSNGGSYNPADYSNDVFFPYTSGVTEYLLRIYNRWGELIFESHDINIGWDGYFNGKLCQQDTYVWQANVKFFDNRKYNKTGNLTLLR